MVIEEDMMGIVRTEQGRKESSNLQKTVSLKRPREGIVVGNEAMINQG